MKSDAEVAQLKKVIEQLIAKAKHHESVARSLAGKNQRLQSQLAKAQAVHSNLT